MSEQVKAILLLLLLAFLAGGCAELFLMDSYSVTQTVETTDYDHNTTSTVTSDNDTTIDGRTWCFAIVGDCVVVGSRDEQR